MALLLRLRSRTEAAKLLRLFSSPDFIPPAIHNLFRIRHRTVVLHATVSHWRSNYSCPTGIARPGREV